MQTQPKHAVRTTRYPTLSARRELRGNVIQWRDEAIRRRQPNPATATHPAPGEDGSKPLVSVRAQNWILMLMATAAVCVFVLRAGGVL